MSAQRVCSCIGCELCCSRPSSDRSLLHHVDEALAEALVVCRNMREPPASQAHASLPPHLGRGITPVDCDGNAELPMLGGACTFRRSKPLGMIKGLREILWQTLEAGGTWSAATRIHQLGDASVDYSWLWQLNLHHCSVWDADKFVRFRLGSAGPLEPNVCAVCHPGSTKALHMLVVAIYETTRRHHAVANLVHEADKNCGLTAETAVPGLGHRLASSGHTHVCSKQLRLLVLSLHAFGAGVDCTNTAVATDLANGCLHLATFRRENISYTPIM